MNRRSAWSADEVAVAAQLACVLEVSAEKPGNITPSHAFGDTSFEDMLRSAIALGPELARAGGRGVGETVLAVVRGSRRAARANTNLGIALLLAPIARAALDPALAGVPLRARVAAVLRAFTLDDARAAYAAIRLAEPGGLDAPVDHDVRAEPAITLHEAMARAAGRDRIASEYASDFAVTFTVGVPALTAARAQGPGERDAIVELHLRLLAAVPDTLIARKRGPQVAQEVSARAAEVLAAGGVRTAPGRSALAAFDASLRDRPNALNPGTTADLVAATLFVTLLEGV